MNPRKNNRLTVNKRFHSQRSAFTLIELLTVISIIGVLSSMVLFALFSVAENARKQRTKAQIAKIHELISGRWESYLTRPMPIKIPPRTTHKGSTILIDGGIGQFRWKPGQPTNPRAAALVRLIALQELMRLEMPDRIADITGLKSSTPKDQFKFARNPFDKRLDSDPGKLIWREGSSLSRAHELRRTGTGKWTPTFQSAECLYMILASIQDGDTNGLDFFREREKGDVDSDGMPEILDGWGQPIDFLRWAPAYSDD
ncbi:MAG TPA: type II secretion system protein, partial [Planctomycetaceae bacterium]|nr:type II secretion system protein [Planctomycetaceae bacterium]